MDIQNFAPTGELARIKHGEHVIPETPHPYNGQDPLNVSFPSVAAMCDYMRANLGDKYHVSLEYGHFDWAWGCNTNQALRMAEIGWPSGSAYVKTAHVDVANAYMAEHSTEGTVYDVTGSMVDVAAFLSGTPECMIEFANVPRETREVRIIVDGFVSAGVSTEMIFQRGIAVMAAILAVQAQGVAVTLDMATKETIGYDNLRTQRGCVTLHRPGDAMDTSRLAFFLAHPAFIRLLFGGALYMVAGVNTSLGTRNPDPLKPGTVRIEGMIFDEHPWGTPEANKALIEKIFSAAI